MKIHTLLVSALALLLSALPAAAQQVSIIASDPWGNKAGSGDPVAFTVTRTGATASALTVNLSISGTATPGTDYPAVALTKTIAAGQTTSRITITPTTGAPNRTGTPPSIMVGLAAGSYTIDSGNSSATAYIAQNANLNIYGEDMVVTMRKVTTTTGGSYELNIPQRNGIDIPVIRGVIVGAPGDGGADYCVDFDRWCYDMNWAYLAQKFASDTAANPINALTALAATAGHSELQYAPICTRGFSRGGALAGAMAKAYPARMVAFYARGWARADWSGSAPFAPSAATAAVPGWFDTGAVDGYAGVMRTSFERGRAMGALWCYSEYNGEGHGADAASEVAREFFEACIALRYDYQQGVVGKDPKLGTVNLIALNESAGWVGEHLYGKNRGAYSTLYSAEIPNWHRDFETRNPFVSPVASFDRTDTGTSMYYRQHSWLPNERIARVWAQHTGMGWDSLALKFEHSAPYLVNAGQPITCTLDTGGFPEAVKAEFFVDEVKVHETSTQPFTHTYTVSASGGHVLWARATSADGAVRITSSHKRSRLGYGNRYIRVRPATELGNTAPTISLIPKIRLRSGDTNGVSIPFTIGDAETAAANLTVDNAYNRISWPFNGTATITGTGANRILTVTDSGTSLSDGTFYRGSVKVSDGFLSTEQGFDVEILPAAGSNAPAFAYPTNGDVSLDPCDSLWSSTGTFAVTDADTALDQITTTFTYSNVSNLPAASIRLSQWGPVRSLRVRKVFVNWNPIGMRLSLSDGANSTQASSDVYFANVPAQTSNEAPWLSTIPDQSCVQGGQTAPVIFRLGDLNWQPDELIVTATSSNPTLLPDANIILAKLGNAQIDRDRSIICQPAPGRYGTATITVRVAEPSANPVAPFGPLFSTKTFVLTVNAPPALTSAAPTDGVVGTAYSYTYTASGTGPITYSVTAGTLPDGLVLSSTGLLSGTPTSLGTFTGTVTATNGTAPPATQPFSITIGAAPVAPAITSTAPAGGAVGVLFSHTYASSGTGPITYSVTAGTLPGGLTLSGAGLLSGTPTAAGTFTGIVTATNGTGPGATQAFSILIRVAPVITSAAPAGGALGTAYNHTYTASGTGPIVYSVTAGTLPDGLSLSSAGVLSGTPTTVGTFTGTVTASNGTMPNATQAFSLVIRVAPLITSAAPPGGAMGTPYSTHTYTASGSGPITYSVTAGALPAGLILSSAGVLSGTPTTAGTFTGTVTAANGAAPNATQSFSIVISVPLGTLVQWTTFGGNSGSNRNISETTTIVAGNLAASSGVLSRGAKFNPTGDQSYGPWSSNFFGTQDAAVSANLAAAVTNNIYAACTVTPLAGYATSVSGVSFFAYDLQSPSTVELLYSTNGFSTSVSLGTKTTGSTLLSYDTSAVAALQNVTTPVAFRFYFWGEAGGYQVRGIGVDPNSTSAPVLKISGTMASTIPPAVAAPVFSPVAGTYTSAQSVTLSTTTAGATIRYTTDGSTPTNAVGTVYSAPVSVGVSRTLKAIAYKSGMTDSAVASAAYIINLPSDLAIFRLGTGLAADGSQDLLNPAGDGVANLLKYAFNMIGSGAGQGTTLATPNSAVLAPNGFAGLPFATVDGSGKLALIFIRRKASSNSGINYAVEFSDALASWDVNGSATESTVSIDATFERVTVTDSASPASRFVRVKVTVP